MPWRRIEGVELYLHTFLTLVLDVGEWSSSRPSHFTPQERAPGTHWVNPKRRYGHSGEEKNPNPWRDSNPGSPTQPSHYTDWPSPTRRINLLTTKRSDTMFRSACDTARYIRYCAGPDRRAIYRCKLNMLATVGVGNLCEVAGFMGLNDNMQRPLTEISSCGHFSLMKDWFKEPNGY
jgi:hypothetical protein